MNRRDFGALLAAAAAMTLPAAARAETAWEFTFEALEGGLMPLSQWRGKVLLVVNTASFCGFTPQYADLVEVWQDYRDRGLVVIGAPSTDFRQEYDEAGKIRDFCELTYGVDFPMTAPVHVVGPDAHPFFKWAAAETGQRVRWNFDKYLVGRDGRILTWMPSSLKPTTRKARAAIEAALAAPEA
ncbi:glutathione peroxidase [Meinhardsimonia xiamenensis]|jgi:glutathione peroxidase|uniref:Glutathione peroxidase n=1 Tax=Meinhardsimonia xiamenensis TaxID=990712 RepID=A0A1G9BBM9_9RHOB|nr:glutathione peroxidase [Meinhardsimonia xiamenensis]PRX35063.1 glutathione peroxidase [Meinhardsimonia xiamenensis]SDK36275.1 glutathione peroxidase [Meinhardsimonia xiamenensis]